MSVVQNRIEVYNVMKQTISPRKASDTPLRWKDGTKLHISMAEIAKNWKERFSDLLNRDSRAGQSVLNQYLERPIMESMNDRPTLKEVKISISKLNMVKAVGKGGVFTEIIRYGGDYLTDSMSSIILNI